jgi:hypothetical protein
MPEVREQGFSNWNKVPIPEEFEKYADGKVYAYTSGNDYDSKDNSFAAKARKWGATHGYVTKASIPREGVVEIRFIKVESE